MSDDLVKRLRCYADLNDAVFNPWVYGEAADRIEKLEAALREMAESAWDCTGDTCGHCKPDNCSNRDIARKALDAE
jgi:pyruvate-formate lyase-activating enzyme